MMGGWIQTVTSDLSPPFIPTPSLLPNMCYYNLNAIVFLGARPPTKAHPSSRLILFVPDPESIMRKHVKEQQRAIDCLFLR